MTPVLNIQFRSTNGNGSSLTPVSDDTKAKKKKKSSSDSLNTDIPSLLKKVFAYQQQNIKNNPSWTPNSKNQEQIYTGQELKKRLATKYSKNAYILGLTPDQLKEILEELRPDILKKLPVSLDTKVIPPLKREHFKRVQSFTKDSVKQEFQNTRQKNETEDKILRYVAIVEGPNSPTGAQIEVVNNTGLSNDEFEKKFWSYINNSINEGVRTEIWGVVLHELLHRYVAEACDKDLLKISGWDEMIKIGVSDFKKEGELMTSGQADMDENIESTSKELQKHLDGVQGFWNNFKQKMLEFNNVMMNFNQAVQRNMTGSAQQAVNFCNNTLRFIDVKTKELTDITSDFFELSKQAMILILSSMSPMLLLNSKFYVHAGTISSEDVEIKNIFAKIMHECLEYAQESKQRLADLANIRKQIITIKQQLIKTNGRMFAVLTLPESFRQLGEQGLLAQKNKKVKKKDDDDFKEKLA